MNALEQLLEKHKSGEIESFAFQEGVFDFYRHSDKSQAVKNAVLTLVEQCLKDDIGQDYMWAVFFEADRHMYRQIILLKTKVMAQDAFERNLRQPNHALLEMSASLAHTSCKTDEDTIDQDKKAIWLKVFEPMAQFKEMLEAEISYWQDFHQQQLKQYHDYYANRQAVQQKPIVKSYEIVVPVKQLPEISLDLPEITTLAGEIVESFHCIALQGFIKHFKGKCSRSHAQFMQGFTFTFECHEPLSQEELSEAQIDFMGQLSDGWGEGASQKKILVGSQEVYLDFDLKRAGNFTELPASEPTKKVRP